MRFCRRQIALTLSALMLALTAPVVTAAEQPGSAKLASPDPSPRLLPLKGASSGNSCAALGPGFIKVDGTNTCVKIGGSISIESHTSR